jgi:hypothetical protein
LQSLKEFDLELAAVLSKFVLFLGDALHLFFELNRLEPVVAIT